jgi:hypothetical protein
MKKTYLGPKRCLSSFGPVLCVWLVCSLRCCSLVAGVGVGAVGVDEAVVVEGWCHRGDELAGELELVVSAPSAFSENHVLRRNCWMNSVQRES